jgi:hypothetical protein
MAAKVVDFPAARAIVKEGAPAPAADHLQRLADDPFLPARRARLGPRLVHMPPEPSGS